MALVVLAVVVTGAMLGMAVVRAMRSISIL